MHAKPSHPSVRPPADIARPLAESVPYGVDIASCNVPGRVALTFDDGPSAFTPELLDILDESDAKVRNLTRFMLDTLQDRGLGTSVTVGECLRDPVENWYWDAGPVVECPASFSNVTVGQNPSPEAEPLSWSPPRGV